MCLKSSPFLSDEYQSQDIVHGIWEKPSSTDCDGLCRADNPKERSNAVCCFVLLNPSLGIVMYGPVTGKIIGSRVRQVAIAVAVSD